MQWEFNCLWEALLLPEAIPHPEALLLETIPHPEALLLETMLGLSYIH